MLTVSVQQREATSQHGAILTRMFRSKNCAWLVVCWGATPSAVLLETDASLSLSACRVQLLLLSSGQAKNSSKHTASMGLVSHSQSTSRHGHAGQYATAGPRMVHTHLHDPSDISCTGRLQSITVEAPCSHKMPPVLLDRLGKTN